MSKTPKVDKLVTDYEHLPISANAKVWNLARELEKQNALLLEALEMAFGLLQEYRGMYQHPDNIDPVVDEIEAVLMAAKGEA